MPAPAGFNPEYAACPKCNGDMWDNRGRKRNPKAPDFKCKDKACDGAVWMEPKGGGGPQRGSQMASRPLPELSQAQKKAGRDKVLADYFGLMDQIASRMGAIAKTKGLTLTMENVQAATYSAYGLMDKKRYIAEPVSTQPAAVEPPKRLPPPPRQSEPEEWPDPMEVGDEQELPF